MDIKPVVVYEVADGSRFNSLEEAQEYDARMLCHELFQEIVIHDFEPGQKIYFGGWNKPATLIEEKIHCHWRYLGDLGKKALVRYNVLHCFDENSKQTLEFYGLQVIKGLRATPDPNPRKESD
jgi:hypothetical protein